MESGLGSFTSCPRCLANNEGAGQDFREDFKEVEEMVSVWDLFMRKGYAAALRSRHDSYQPSKMEMARFADELHITSDVLAAYVSKLRRASGLTWKHASEETHQRGVELQHPALAEALCSKSVFSRAEWAAFEIQVSLSSLALVCGKCYT